MEKLLGPRLLTKAGEAAVGTAEALGDAEVVLLQFSAHWCPPCRSFTPVLADFVKSFEGKDQKPPAVVFVSSDRSEDDFTGYYKEMPWLALPYEDRDTKTALSRKYKVSGIPTLIAVDAKTGKTIAADARSRVQADPENYPWLPQKFDEITDKLVRCGATADGAAGDALNFKEHLAGKYVGLYFSAHWCPPCQRFTPKLIETYKALRKSRDDFEFVFVTSDREEGEFNNYTKDMPWVAIPFSEKSACRTLGSNFGVEGIPTLVILGPDGKTISGSAVSSVSQDPEGADFPWHPKAVSSLEEGAGYLNDETCLVVLQEAAGAADQAAAQAALATIHEELKAQGAAAADGDDDDDGIKFMVANGGDDIATQIRSLTKLPAPKPGEKRTVCSGDLCSQVDATSPLAVILDIPDEGGFYVCEDVVTEASMRKFVADYKAKKLERKQLSRG